MEAKVTMMGPVTRVTACHMSSACHVLSLGHTCVSLVPCVTCGDVSWPGLASILTGEWRTLGH